MIYKNSTVFFHLAKCTYKQIAHRNFLDIEHLCSVSIEIGKKNYVFYEIYKLIHLGHLLQSK